MCSSWQSHWQLNRNQDDVLAEQFPNPPADAWFDASDAAEAARAGLGTATGATPVRGAQRACPEPDGLGGHAGWPF